MPLFNTVGLAIWQITAITLTTASLPYPLVGTNMMLNRKTLVLYNVSDTNIYVGDYSVTTTNGILISPGDKLALDSSGGLWAVCGTGGKIINIMEGA